MKHLVRWICQHWLLAALIALIVVQSGFLVRQFVHQSTTEIDVRRVQVGDTLVALSGLDANGNAAEIPMARADDVWTVLLAFDSDCAFCEQVAPAWKDWLSADRNGVHAVAITSDPVEVARRYRERHGWDVPLLIIRDRKTTLLRRTPWFYVFSPAGELRFENHGAFLDRIDDIIHQQQST